MNPKSNMKSLNNKPVGEKKNITPKQWNKLLKDFGWDSPSYGWSKEKNILKRAIKLGYQLAIKDVEKLECMKEEVIDNYTEKQCIAIETMNEGNISAREIIEEIGESFNQRNSLRNQIKQQLQSLLKEK